MNKYPKYKDSGIDWLGDIPKHWERQKIMGITKIYSIKNRPKEELLSVYRDYGVIIKSSRDDNHNKPGLDLSNNKYVFKGALVLNKMKTWQGSLGVSKYEGIVSPAYITCKINFKKVEGDFLNFLLRCKNYIFEYNRLSYGVRPSQWDMRYDDFKNIVLFLPPKPEQTTIANFLDYKLEKIDRFITKKKALIELLNEQKAAIINQAVTKGLNPNAKMKPSGIEWLGDIPESWAQTKLKSIGFLYGGLSGKSGKDFKIDNHPNNKYYIPFTNIANNSIINNNQLDTVIFYENEKQNEVLKNDLLFLMSSETYDDIGKSALMKYDINEAYLNSFCKGFRIVSKHINSSFLNFLLMANVYRTQLIIEARGFTRINLKIQKVKDLTFFYPNSIEEQTKILTYIETETIKIDKTIATIKKEISLVEEYKTALIAEAVTGKIDVRDFEIPQIEMPLAMVAEEAANYNKKN